MNTPSELGNLKLSVTNFGPIARADIDLRPMTVFVGPSNTGKSYLAILIYVLHRFFSGRAFQPALPPMLAGRSIFGLGLGSPDDQAVSREDIEALFAWLSGSLPETGTSHSQDAVSTVLPESAARLVRYRLEAVGARGYLLNAEMARCFGIEDISSLVRNRIKSGGRAVVKRPVVHADAGSDWITFDFNIVGESRDLGAVIPTGAPLRFTANEQQHRQILGTVAWLRSTPRDDWDSEGPYIAGDLISQLADVIGGDIVSPLGRAAHYLPADRTGVMHAHRVVVGSIIGQASRAGFQHDTPLPPLSGVLADFLEQLIGLGGRREGDVEKTLARQIERDILQGEVRMGETLVGYPEFFYRPEGWKDDLRLVNTSSMVSELAPVVLYLRHVVRPGEVLIIEEPESHLHPAMQVEFIRHLASAVQAGVRVILTTHSEWVLDELTNLVRLSELPKSRRREFGGADFALDPDKLGVWLFEPKRRPKGSVVKEIPFDEGFGGFRSGFDDVAMGTYNDYAAISNRIEETRAEYRTP